MDGIQATKEIRALENSYAYTPSTPDASDAGIASSICICPRDSDPATRRYALLDTLGGRNLIALRQTVIEMLTLSGMTLLSQRRSNRSGGDHCITWDVQTLLQVRHVAV